MMLPRTGAGLPAWRRQVMPWLMAAVRLVVAWFVIHGAFTALVLHPSFLRDAVPAPTRYLVAALMALGFAAFVWPATCIVGFLLLTAGLLAFEWIWQHLGLASGSLPWAPIAAFGVLAFGEWLVRRLQGRLYQA
jgi:hypothetical protein